MQKRRRNGDNAPEGPKPKVAKKVAAQPIQKAVTFADEVAQLTVGNHEEAAALKEEVDALKEENEHLRGQNADLKQENEQLRSQKTADDRKMEALAQKVQVLCGLVQVCSRLSALMLGFLNRPHLQNWTDFPGSASGFRPFGTPSPCGGRTK